MTANIATSFLTGAAKSTFKYLAKDRNVLIPLDDPTKTKFLTNTELKKEVCGKQSPKQKPPEHKRKSNFGKMMERVG